MQPLRNPRGRRAPAEDENDELVPAVAHRHVVGPAVGAQDDSDSAQHLVANGVRVAVVDLLEIVDVDEHRGQVIPGAVDFVGHHLPVSQAREVVEQRGLTHPARLGGERTHLVDGLQRGESAVALDPHPFEGLAGQTLPQGYRRVPSVLGHVQVGQCLHGSGRPDVAARPVGVGQCGKQLPARLVVVPGLRGCLAQDEAREVGLDELVTEPEALAGGLDSCGGEPGAAEPAERVRLDDLGAGRHLWVAGQGRDPAHPEGMFGAGDQVRRCLLGVADDQESRPPECAQQRALLGHQQVDVEVATGLDPGQQIFCLLEQVDGAERQGDRHTRGKMVVAAWLRSGDEPRALSQRIHRPADLPDLGRGLGKKCQCLRPPHRVGVVLHVVEKVHRHGHRFAVPAKLLQGDTLDVAQELSGGPVARTLAHQHPRAAGVYGVLGVPVQVKLVGGVRESVERPELAYPLECGASSLHHRCLISSGRAQTSLSDPLR